MCVHMCCKLERALSHYCLIQSIFNVWWNKICLNQMPHRCVWYMRNQLEYAQVILLFIFFYLLIFFLHKWCITLVQGPYVYPVAHVVQHLCMLHLLYFTSILRCFELYFLSDDFHSYNFVLYFLYSRFRILIRELWTWNIKYDVNVID